MIMIVVIQKLEQEINEIKKQLLKLENDQGKERTKFNTCNSTIERHGIK